MYQKFVKTMTFRGGPLGSKIARVRFNAVFLDKVCKIFYICVYGLCSQCFLETHEDSKMANLVTVHSS